MFFVKCWRVVSDGFFLQKPSTKARWGQFPCFEIFCRKSFLDKSNRGRDFWGDVWNLAQTFLGDVWNQRVRPSRSDDVWNPWKNLLVFGDVWDQKAAASSSVALTLTFSCPNPSCLGEVIWHCFLCVWGGGGVMSPSFWEMLFLLLRNALLPLLSLWYQLGGGGRDVTLFVKKLKNSFSEGRQCFLNQWVRSPVLCYLCYETYILDLFGCSYLVLVRCCTGKSNSLVFWR